MYTLAFITTVVQSTADEGLTLSEVFDSLPVDPVSLAVLAMLAGSFGLVIWAGRGKGKGNGPKAA